jgi:hypothetical protein
MRRLDKLCTMAGARFIEATTILAGDKMRE